MLFAACHTLDLDSFNVHGSAIKSSVRRSSVPSNVNAPDKAAPRSLALGQRRLIGSK
jgi:hypothetical protein